MSLMEDLAGFTNPKEASKKVVLLLSEEDIEQFDDEFNKYSMLMQKLRGELVDAGVLTETGRYEDSPPVKVTAGVNSGRLLSELLKSWSNIESVTLRSALALLPQQAGKSAHALHASLIFDLPSSLLEKWDPFLRLTGDKFEYLESALTSNPSLLTYDLLQTVGDHITNKNYPSFREIFINFTESPDYNSLERFKGAKWLLGKETRLLTEPIAVNLIPFLDRKTKLLKLVSEEYNLGDMPESWVEEFIVSLNQISNTAIVGDF